MLCLITFIININKHILKKIQRKNIMKSRKKEKKLPIIKKIL